MAAIATISSNPAQYALELESMGAGFLISFEGGDVTADVIAEKPSSDGIVHKHIGGVKYEDMSVEIGADMSASVYEWIADTLGRMYRRRDGAIVATDKTFRATSRLEFFHALIREITFPPLDATSKNPGSIQIKFAPEYTRLKQSSGQIFANERKSQQWFVSDFRLQIDGLDCSRVTAIDALTISRAVEPDTVIRDYQKVGSSPLVIPNLAFTIEESAADSLRAWHEDFVIRGNNTSAAEKNGTLRFLSPNLQETLFTVTLNNLGIFKLAVDKTETSNAVLRLRAEMYCEEISLQYKTGATPTVTTSPANPTENSVDVTNRGTPASPPLRGGTLPTAATSSSLAGSQSQPTASEAITNPLNLGRPLKFRT